MPDLDDVDAILAVVNADPDEVLHAVPATVDATFTWDYGKGQRPAAREALREGEDRAVERVHRSRLVDRRRSRAHRDGAGATATARMQYVRRADGREGFAGRVVGRAGVRSGTRSRTSRTGRASSSTASRARCSAPPRIVETVPWIDAKYYASTQVMDEARHVEVFGRYLDEKLETRYPMNAHLGALIDDVLADSRWDITYLGMQIMIEGLALAAFGSMYQTLDRAAAQAAAPLRDVGRSASCGVRGAVVCRRRTPTSPVPELRERQEFVYEAALRMRDRFLHQEVWERLGVSRRARSSRTSCASTPRRSALPADAVRQDRAELQEARSARRARRLAARPVHRDGRHRVRGPRRHRVRTTPTSPSPESPQTERGTSSKAWRCSMAATDRSIIERVRAAPRSSAASSVDVATTGYTNAHATLRR